MEKYRDLTLDKLRGLAVLLMILAHSIVFFNFERHLKLAQISDFIDIVAFTVFLFVSGGAAYYAYLASERSNAQISRSARYRSLSLLVVYYGLGIFVSLDQLIGLSWGEALKEVLKILSFINVPGYCEVLLPFVILGIIVGHARSLFIEILHNKLLLLAFLILPYFLGLLLHRADIGMPLNYYTSLLAGESDWYRFPLLQYFPVFLLGMAWSRYVHITNTMTKKQNALVYLILLLPLLLAYRIVNQFFDFNFLPPLMQRWPPAPDFLLIGMIFALVLILILEITKKNTVFLIIQWALNLMGKSAFGLYVFHLLVLFTYRFLVNKQVPDVAGVIGMFFLVLALSSIAIRVIKLLVTSLKSDNRLGLFSNFLAFIYKQKFEVLTLLVLVVTAGLFFGYYKQQGIDVDATNKDGIVVQNEDSLDAFWWDNTYPYRMQITLQNNSQEKLLYQEYVQLTFDHQSLVGADKSRADGGELQVVFLGDSEYHVLTTKVINANTIDAQLYFPLARSLDTGKSDQRYFIYYGSEAKVNENPDNTVPVQLAQEYQIKFGEEQLQAAAIEVNERWVLKGSNLEAQHKTATIEVKFKEGLEATMPEVFLSNAQNEYPLAAEPISENNFRVTLDSDLLAAGDYQITALLNGTEYSSRENVIHVSYPLYVVWTIDWEGFDVSEQYLRSMEDISRKYDIPMVQLFNPRIFIAEEISPERAQRLVSWVLDRKRLSDDEIGLHLHMHYDLIAATGIEPKTDPKWGGRENGHDVLTSAYSYDEFYQIIEWSKQKFAENGLPVPRSFRAGGWFADADNLRTLNDNEFYVDSSGREYYIWGPNRQEGFWNLKSTSKPYRPSVINQNNGEIQPLLDMWEFPNNGMDSTNQGADVLINKFNDNYKGVALTEPQAVTYLSHPHWFDIYDHPKIVALLDHTEQFSFAQNKGPVLYGTFEEILPLWQSQ